MLIIKWTT